MGNRRGNTMQSKLLLAIVAAVVLQVILFVLTVTEGGILKQLDYSAYETFSERVVSTRSNLEYTMLQRWSNITPYETTIGLKLNQYMLEHDISYEELSADGELTTQFLKTVTDDLISMMRKVSVSGGFVVLDTPLAANQGYYGLYISDSDPNTYPADNSDLLLDIGPASIAKEQNIPLNTTWLNRFALSESEQSSDFFYKPFRAAAEYPMFTEKSLGYWAKDHAITLDSPSVISYSLPIVLDDGQVVGVMGIDMQLEHLQSFLPYKLLQNDRQGIYTIGVAQASELDFDTITYNGPLYHNLFASDSRIAFAEEAVYHNIYAIKDYQRGDGDIYGSIDYLKLYDSNGPYSDEQWAVIGMAQKHHLLALSERIIRSLLVVSVVTLLISIVVAFFMIRRMIKPINRLVAEVRESDPSQEVMLSKTHIKEIDALGLAIEQLSNSASKFSQIIDLLNLPIGGFEYDKQSEKVYCTAVMMDFIGLPSHGAGYIGKDMFAEKMVELTRFPEEKREGVYRMGALDQPPGWFRIRQMENEFAIWGIVMDVTEEVVEKQRIQYERDYDLLTNLLNRRAFSAQVKGRFTEGLVEKAVFIMWDLDELKYINDTYGHDYGDEYIQKAAIALQRYQRCGGVVARMSGDEFYVFIDQIDDKERVLERIYAIHQQLLETEMRMPNGNIIKLSASAGMAWYPEDADNFELLVKYADFAMYQAKRAQKGTMRPFERESYEKDSFLLNSKEDLDMLINEEKLHYVYQPIVSAQDGHVYAYEALLRSEVATLKSPLDILRLAKYLSKLPEVEWLTMKCALAGYARQIESFGEAKLFINSIPNVSLRDAELERLEKDYGPYLHRVVLELIENENMDESSTAKKQAAIARWGGYIAVDDFGAGYNNDLLLLTLKPAYVKIDKVLIDGIAGDTTRQNIVRNLINYFAESEVETVAEGIETSADMETLINMGIDYLQGYYIGMPMKTPLAIKNEVVGEIQTFYAKAHAKKAQTMNQVLLCDEQ